MRPYIANDVKFNNRKTVYNLISQKEIVSRTDISKEIGISSPTVMKIMNYMESKDIVSQIDGEITQSSVGRKPQQYKFNSDLCYAIGIILEGEYLRLGLVNILGKIIEHTTVKCNVAFDEKITKVFEESINKLINKTDIPLQKIVGIGIGVPGIYDDKNNNILVAPLIGIQSPTNVDFLVDYLTNVFNVPVILGNDVNMEALGEYHHAGLSQDNMDMLYISLGTGVGAGIILDGKLRVGNVFNAGEIGYMAFLGDYIAGKNNPGWLESKINLSGLKQRFNFDVYDDNNDSKIDEIVEYVSIPIALCINNITTVLDLKNITIGGILTERLGEKFILAVAEKVKQLSIFDVTIKSKILQESGVVGSTIAIFDRYILQMLNED